MFVCLDCCKLKLRASCVNVKLWRMVVLLEFHEDVFTLASMKLTVCVYAV